MKFTPEQREHVDRLIEQRLIKDRKVRSRDVQALVLERDRLAIEVGRLRAALQTEHQKEI